MLSAQSFCKSLGEQWLAGSSAWRCVIKHSRAIWMRAQACKHPLLVIGAGANRKMTSKMLRRFVELTKIPWVESQMGKGVIDARMLPYHISAVH